MPILVHVHVLECDLISPMLVWLHLSILQTVLNLDSMRIRSSVSAHAWHCGIMVLRHHGIAATVLVVVSLIAVCCSGESDTSTQLLFINYY